MNADQIMTPARPQHAYGIGARVVDGLLWVFGGIALFLGMFVLVGPHEAYLGLGGRLAWRVGAIHPAWGYGLLAAGLVAVAAGAALSRRLRHAPRVETSPGAALLVHAGVFLGVNAFLWAQDIALGDGLNYAYLMTLPWAVGLLAHLSGYLQQRAQDRRGPV